jgi:hypothetical protein
MPPPSWPPSIPQSPTLMRPLATQQHNQLLHLLAPVDCSSSRSPVDSVCRVFSHMLQAIEVEEREVREAGEEVVWERFRLTSARSVRFRSLLYAHKIVPCHDDSAPCRSSITTAYRAWIDNNRAQRPRDQGQSMVQNGQIWADGAAATPGEEGGGRIRSWDGARHQRQTCPTEEEGDDASLIQASRPSWDVGAGDSCRNTTSSPTSTGRRPP